MTKYSNGLSFALEEGHCFFNRFTIGGLALNDLESYLPESISISLRVNKALSSGKGLFLYTDALTSDEGEITRRRRTTYLKVPLFQLQVSLRLTLKNKRKGIDDTGTTLMKTTSPIISLLKYKLNFFHFQVTEAAC